MTLDYNGKLHQFYRWNYEDSCPSNLCPFFWKMLFAALLFPITWWTYPVKRFAFGGRVVGGLLSWFGAAVIGYVIGTALQGDYLGIKLIGTGMGLLVAGVILFLLIALPAAGIANALESKTYNEIKGVLIARKEGFFEKYCPRIDWKV